MWNFHLLPYWCFILSPLLALGLRGLKAFNLVLFLIFSCMVFIVSNLEARLNFSRGYQFFLQLSLPPFTVTADEHFPKNYIFMMHHDFNFPHTSSFFLFVFALPIHAFMLKKKLKHKLWQRSIRVLWRRREAGKQSSRSLQRQSRANTNFFTSFDECTMSYLNRELMMCKLINA